MPRLAVLLWLLPLYAAGSVAGWAFAWAQMPLPWMLGPLFLTGLLYLTGRLDRKVPVKTRPFGQMTVAAQVGLAFSPQAFAALLTLAPLLIGTALLTGITALTVGFMLARRSKWPLAQAVLATFPTSPVEAAVLAERHGFEPAPVVLAQTIRIALVVFSVPMAIYAVDGWPDRTPSVSSAGVDLLGWMILALISVFGAQVFRVLGLSNPYFLGPLVVVAVVSAFGVDLTPFPAPLMALAQVLLGTWLGSTFRREIFVQGGRQVLTLLGNAALLLVVVSTFALVLARLTGQPWEVLVLGAAPGGVTEMALTAKYLGADLALVTAFQLTRIVLFMPNMPWIVALVDRMERRDLR